MKKISIVSGCYNEEGNIQDLYDSVISQLEKYKNIYDYEFIVIDNSSTDKSSYLLKKIASEDKNFKVIINSKNFGPLKSPFYAMQKTTGDAMIYLASDLQDPPELIPQLIKKWEDGYKIAVGIKASSCESKKMWRVRQFFYKLMDLIQDQDNKILENFTGYGLYDKQIVELMRQTDDPNPYIKSFISDVGFEIAQIEFVQPKRKSGKTNFNFFALYGYAINLITKHSILPIRIATLLGFVLSIVSLLTAIVYLIYKLFNWEGFSMGMAPVVIGLFFFSAVQLLFAGIIGEYIGAIYKRVDKKPLVIEKERINFEEKCEIKL